MKKIIFILFGFVSLLFSWENQTQNMGQIIKLDTHLKGSHKDSIVGFDLFQDKKLLSCSTSNIKIWDIQEQELIKTLPFDRIQKAFFSKDGSKIFVATYDMFYVLDANSYKIIGKIKCGSNVEDAVSFDNDTKIIISSYYSNTNIYSLEDGSLLLTLKNSDNTRLDAISPNQIYSNSFLSFCSYIQ